MSATIWINTDKEETIELGNTIELFKVFDEWRDRYNLAEEYPNLDLVPDQTMHTDDADKGWLAQVHSEAKAFLQEHRKGISEHAKWVLEQLISK